MPKQIKPKVTFYIDKSNRRDGGKGKAPIKANVTINYKNVTKIIEHSFPTDWNPNQQRVRPPRQGGKDNNYEMINKKLDILQKDFEKFADNCNINRIDITPQIVKQFFEGKRSPTEKPFWNAYQEFIDTFRGKPKTKQNYELYKTKLSEFENDTSYFIDYHTLNSVFFERYKQYVYSDKIVDGKKVEGLSCNTLSTAIKKLKFFMNWAAKMKYHNEIEYRKFSAPEFPKTIIFLTYDELLTLYNFKFDCERLEKVRDRYCFGCFTGLALADLKALTHEHINDNAIKKLREKTNIPLNIPIAKQAKDIIKKYMGKHKVLPSISDQKYNEYISECCEIAGIKTPTVYKTCKKGIVEEHIDPKFKLITSHTARKTFTSYLYFVTKDVLLTAKIAGCSPEIVKKHYVGLYNDQASEAINKAFGDL